MTPYDSSFILGVAIAILMIIFIMFCFGYSVSLQYECSTKCHSIGHEMMKVSYGQCVCDLNTKIMVIE